VQADADGAVAFGLNQRSDPYFSPPWFVVGPMVGMGVRSVCCFPTVEFVLGSGAGLP
jgi:hypothetical protein